MKLAPSILAADMSQLGNEVKKIEGADYCHIDIMDGIFVPNISFGMPIVKCIRDKSDMVFDVHLMIQKPGLYIEEFIKCGADIVTIHIESEGDTRADLELIRDKGAVPGIVMKPNTPVEEVYPYLDVVGQVLIMSVEPGFGGQKFIEATYEKIRTLNKYLDENNLDIDIEVDGGVTLDNVGNVISAGANVLVAGSSVFKGNVEENVEKFKEKFQKI